MDCYFCRHRGCLGLLFCQTFVNFSKPQRKIITISVLLWKKKQPEFYVADLFKSIDFGTSILMVVRGKAGRLTRPTIDKLLKYYKNAIRRCVDKKAKTKREIDNAVTKMQGAIKGVLYYSVKTVDEKAASVLS